MVRRLILLLCLLTVFAPATTSAQRRPADAVPDRPGTSKAWLRLDWLYKRRAFPNAQVPANAWHEAWLQKQNMPIWQPRQTGIGIQALGAWEHMGPNATNPGGGQSWTGRIHAIAVNPVDNNIIYIGHAKGGVWKTTDGGTTWTPLTDTLSTQTVGCLALDPNDPNTVYFGTGEEYYAGNTLGGVGIWKSTDAGATWTLKGNATFAGQRINAITVNPSNSNNWVVCSDSGFYTTTDGGASFILRKAGFGSALERHPTVPNTLYAAIGYPFGGSASNGVYKSTDGGVNWSLLAGPPTGTNAGRYELSICKGTPSVIYAVATVPSGGNAYKMLGVWRTANDGATWSQVATTATFTASWAQGWYDLAIKADPNNTAVCYVADVVVYKTTNSGGAWTHLPDPGSHPDIHAIEVMASNSNKVYLGEDSGFYVSSDGGATWAHKNTNRGTMEYYAFDIHPTNAALMAGGAQDNSTHVRTAAGGKTFNVVIGGDGFWTAYKASDPLTMLGEYQYGNIYRSVDGGVNWTSVAPAALSGEAPWSTPLANDPNTPTRFYAGTWKVWRSTSSGAAGSWAAISGDVTKGTGYISDLKVAPSNSNYIYTGADDGGFAVSTDGGATWTQRSAGLPLLAVGGVAVDPSNPQICYAGMEGFTAGQHIYKSTNAGVTWNNITGNLPNVPVNSLVAHPTDPNMLFAATDNSVYVTTDGGTTWAIAGTGLPNTMCTMLRINASTNYLNVCTYGRGMWRLSLGSSSAATSLAVANKSGAIGQTVTLSATLTSGMSGVNGKTVTFKVNGVSAGSGTTNASGVATANYTIPESLGAGSFNIDGNFAGDASYDPSSGTGTLTVSKANTSLAVPDKSGVAGASVTLTATLSRSTDGALLNGKTIDFSVNGSSIGTATTNASGIASKGYTIPTGTAAGDIPIGATFAGDALHNASTGAGTLHVQTKTTLSISASSSVGRTTTAIFKATLKAGTTVISGMSIRFKMDGVEIGNAVTDATGKATLSHVITESLGSHTLRVEFDGNATYAPSSANKSITVTVATTKLTVTNASGVYNTTISLKATLKVGTTPIAGQTVTFKVDGVNAGSGVTNASGVASVSHTLTESIAVHVLTAEYAGDGVDYGASTGTGNLTVKSNTKIVGDVITAPAGSAVTFGAKLTRTSDATALSGKTLKFYIGTTLVGSGVTDAAGRATINVTAPGAGVTTTYTIKFAAEALYNASSGKGTVKGT